MRLGELDLVVCGERSGSRTIDRLTSLVVTRSGTLLVRPKRQDEDQCPRLVVLCRSLAGRGAAGRWASPRSMVNYTSHRLGQVVHDGSVDVDGGEVLRHPGCDGRRLAAAAVARADTAPFDEVVDLAVSDVLLELDQRR